MSSKKIKLEKALLIGAILRNQNKYEIENQLDELKYLALTAGADAIDIQIQSINIPNPSTFIGKGKIDIIKNIALELKCKLIIFNNDISMAFFDETFIIAI